MTNPKPISREDARMLMEIQDEGGRLATAKRLGVNNVNPPLEHSPYVRVKSSGLVLPWNELLADQSDICECCDETGNTDPAAWEPKVVTSGTPDEDLHRQAHAIITAQAHKVTDEYRVPNAVNLQPAQYPEGAVSYSDMLDAKTAESLMALKAMA